MQVEGSKLSVWLKLSDFIENFEEIVISRINKIYRVSSNSIICNKSDFYKLKSGKVVDVEKKSAEQLLNLGVVEKVNTKQNKESK